MKSGGPVKLLVVQASTLLHTLLSGALRPYPQVRLLPPAATNEQVRDLILEHHPDVILLDLGLTDQQSKQLLRTLRDNYPVPIIAYSASGKSDGRRALAAIAAGVLDVVVKPAGHGAEPVRKLGEELAQRICTAAVEARPVLAPSFAGARKSARSFRSLKIDPDRYLIAIGASTGGTEAVRRLLSHMPADSPAVVIVQHMPAFFTGSFASRLNNYSPLRVNEAVEGERLAAGHAVVARGDTHLSVRRGAGGWKVHYTHQRPVNRHCPSVDVLFDSAIEAAGGDAIGVLMTGMGADGARGLLRLRNAGGLTIAQNAQSCVVYGMPKVAVHLGAVELSGSPDEIPGLMMQALVQRQRRQAAEASETCRRRSR